MESLVKDILQYLLHLQYMSMRVKLIHDIAHRGKYGI